MVIGRYERKRLLIAKTGKTQGRLRGMLKYIKHQNTLLPFFCAWDMYSDVILMFTRDS